MVFWHPKSSIILVVKFWSLSIKELDYSVLVGSAIEISVPENLS